MNMINILCVSKLTICITFYAHQISLKMTMPKNNTKFVFTSSGCYPLVQSRLKKLKKKDQKNLSNIGSRPW